MTSVTRAVARRPKTWTPEGEEEEGEELETARRPRANELHATGRLCHTQLLIFSKTPADQNRSAELDPRALKVTSAAFVLLCAENLQ